MAAGRAALRYCICQDTHDKSHENPTRNLCKLASQRCGGGGQVLVHGTCCNRSGTGRTAIMALKNSRNDASALLEHVLGANLVARVVRPVVPRSPGHI